jgi:UDP-N-acetylbacillosamine N-acetyltransferase
MNIIAIYGAGGHGKVVADIAYLNNYDKVIFIDDSNPIHINFDTFVQKHIDIPVALGIGVNHIRYDVYQKCIQAGLILKTLIHPTATIAKNVQIADATVVMAHAVINTDTIIGKGCIINTSCIIEHDNQIENFVHISPNVACAGNVTIGELTHIGIGSSIIQNISIGTRSIIGAGSVIVKNIESQILAYGNPCKKIKVIK